MASDLPFYDILVSQNVPLSKSYEKSMTDSAQHQQAKYFFLFSNRFSLFIRATSYGILSPLLIIKTSNLDLWSVFLCFFDISSLFTNVPLAETVRICVDTFYSSEHPPLSSPQQIFVELMEMTTSFVEFSFDDYGGIQLWKLLKFWKDCRR